MIVQGHRERDLCARKGSGVDGPSCLRLAPKSAPIIHHLISLPLPSSIYPALPHISTRTSPTTTTPTMSSTSDNGSCSSSPSTPDALSDEHAPFNSVDLSAWCHSFSPITDVAPWMTHDSPVDCKYSPGNLLMLSDIQQDKSAFECVFVDTSAFSLAYVVFLRSF